MSAVVEVGDCAIGGERLAVIAGPCVIEDEATTMKAAGALCAAAARLGVGFVFKASYDKANRTSLDSFRGVGMDEGLAVLAAVKERFGVPVLTDIHCRSEAAAAAAVADVLQIPALLCRQTDLIVAAAATGRAVNIKKGQFMDPAAMAHAAAKARSAGCERVILTERGTTFGYNNLVVDMRAIPVMKRAGLPVVFDATHSVQSPGGLGSASGGDRTMAATLARAAVAAGADGVFMEVHPDPDRALCDGPNSLSIEEFEPLVGELDALYGFVRSRGGRPS
ncbi:MAG TPA: 3-deoxy-8-phosphooctulonate synthase [Deltaproteobacteria bacterium]|nr:3-deoxy-8-phosphooctulonate synthase [Deltaproteobacteria bacterium]